MTESFCYSYKQATSHSTHLTDHFAKYFGPMVVSSFLLADAVMQSDQQIEHPFSEQASSQKECGDQDRLAIRGR